ncbi:MAG: hypothetical protein ACQESG_03905 [Nanobdellota archaeon]
MHEQEQFLRDHGYSNLLERSLSAFEEKIAELNANACEQAERLNGIYGSLSFPGAFSDTEKLNQLYSQIPGNLADTVKGIIEAQGAHLDILKDKDQVYKQFVDQSFPQIRDTVTGLEDMVVGYGDIINEHDAKVISLTEQVESNVAAAERWQSLCTEKQQEYQTLQEEHTNLQHICDSLREENRTYASQVESNRAAAERWQSLCTEKQQEYQTLQEEHTDLQHICDSLRAENQDYASQLQERDTRFEQEYAAMDQRISVLQQEKEQLEQQLAQYHGEDAPRGMFSKIKDTACKPIHYVRGLFSRGQDASGQEDDLSAYQDLERRCNNLTVENQNYRNGLMRLGNELGLWDADYETVSDAVHLLQQEKAQLETQLAQYQGQAQDEDVNAGVYTQWEPFLFIEPEATSGEETEFWPAGSDPDYDHDEYLRKLVAGEIEYMPMDRAIALAGGYIQ